jgi:hypothetical protein
MEIQSLFQKQFVEKNTEMFRVKPYDTWWFKYDRDDLCVNKSHFVPVIFEPPCT